MSINVYLTAAEVEQNVTTASVARVLTDAATSDIWANNSSINANVVDPDRVFNVDWSLSQFHNFFQIQFEHNDEDAYKIFDQPPPQTGPDPDMSTDTDFDQNVIYRINGGQHSTSSNGFFNTNSMNLFEAPIEGVAGTGLTTNASSPAGAVVPADFVAHGYEAGSENDRTAKNLYISDLAETLFKHAGTAELLSNERTIADQIKAAGEQIKADLDSLINNQNGLDAEGNVISGNSISEKRGKNNSTLIVGKLLRALMKNEFVDASGDTVLTAERVNKALTKWKIHGNGPNDNKISEGGHDYQVWDVNNSGLENVAGADYFNLGSCLRVGEQLRIRAKFNVRDKDNNKIEYGSDGPIVFTAVDGEGNPEHRRHPVIIFEMRINLVP